MKLEVYVMAWWQTQQNIQSLSIPTKYEVGSLCDGLVTDTTKHPIIKYPHEIWSWKSMYGLVTDTTKHPIIKYPHEIWS